MAQQQYEDVRTKTPINRPLYDQRQTAKTRTNTTQRVGNVRQSIAERSVTNRIDPNVQGPVQPTPRKPRSVAESRNQACAQACAKSKSNAEYRKCHRDCVAALKAAELQRD